MTTFYIADTHFDHEKIIALCRRPFMSVDDMNETMVRNWNTVVRYGDTVRFLGDFAWKRHDYWFSRLNGRIIPYRGNHDDGMQCPGGTYAEIQDGPFKLVLCHYPIVSWNGLFKGAFHFYGHVHNEKLEYMPLDWRARSFNVGVECLNYTPQTAEQIIMQGNI